MVVETLGSRGLAGFRRRFTGCGERRPGCKIYRLIIPARLGPGRTDRGLSDLTDTRNSESLCKINKLFN
ncbi:hypothetical protein JTE90_026487 [Oedothorax gibbosus]|uniref:Uncharacterized protein n=1 Tax=Oedothorax gibbosus TaxID=931172 RepID=A0AAV6VPS9_9ARAC|nr:hypothetical protein JTE90_026487 [Oedothorax gibbosus]